jgi:hypothetical protein
MMGLGVELALRTAFPHAGGGLLIPGVLGAAGGLCVLVCGSRRHAPDPGLELTPWERRTWATPPLDRLEPMAASTLRRVAEAASLAYIVTIGALLAISL